MTPQAFQTMFGKARIFDLAQPWRVGMPHWPTHPPFLYSLSKAHGDIVLANGASAAAEVLTLGGHVGTHIDALCHFACNGQLHGGVNADQVQSVDRGFARLGIDTVAPILRRGVLLDVAGGGPLPADRGISAADLERAARAAIGPGDIVLVRTGWARYWQEPRRMAASPAPGVNLEGARWLSSRGVFAAGSDTLAFEAVPSKLMEVHVHLLVEKGVHIIEALNLDELAAAGVDEFLFVASPLKIEGGTGSPIRPFAVAGL